MLWTFAAFLLLLAVLLVHFLKTGIEKLKEAYFVYPSNADIDQMLPMEIMEHMMGFLDPGGLVECRLVSKYWRNHATKKNIQNQVLLQSSLIMTEAFKTYNIPPSDRLEFPLDQNTLIDYATAQKHGATLLDINSEAIDRHKEKLHGERCFVRTRAAKSYEIWDISLYIGQTPMKMQPAPEVLDWHYNATFSELELVFDIADYLKAPRAPQKMYRCRDPEIPKYFWFLPLNYKLLPLMVYIFAPIVVRDILNSPSFLPVIKTWFGPVIFLLVLAVHALIVRESSQNLVAINSSVKIAVTLLFVFYVTSAVVTYPYSSTHFAAIGIISLMFVYYMFLKGSAWRPNQKQIYWKRFYPAILVAVLILFMNDWRSVVDSIRNYAILWVLFNNTVHYGILCLNFVMANFIETAIRAQQLKWSYLVDWDSITVRWLRNSYLLVILMTLYAPGWAGNHV